MIWAQTDVPFIGIKDELTEPASRDHDASACIEYDAGNGCRQHNGREPGSTGGAAINAAAGTLLSAYRMVGWRTMVGCRLGARGDLAHDIRHIAGTSVSDV